MAQPPPPIQTGAHRPSLLPTLTTALEDAREVREGLRDAPASKDRASPTPAWQSSPEQQFTEAPDEEEEADGMGGIRVERCNEKDLGGVMGKAWRNAITGQVQLRMVPGNVPNFCVADLWTRKLIAGNAESLSHDPYIFKPIPMPMRTWIYHHLYREGTMIEAEERAEDTMIRYILKMYCVDANVIGGRWAPMLVHLPMLMCLCLSADQMAVFASIFIAMLALGVQYATNTPKLYRWTRLMTFPLRFFLLLLIVMRMVGAEEPSGMHIAGYVLAILWAFAEILFGDIGFAWSARLLCNYDVLRVLPNRIFVCRRNGAAHSSDIIGRSLPVNEKLTGMGSWQSDYTFIADVKGLIMELRPMGYKDWCTIMNEQNENEDLVHYYIGLDVYQAGAATIDSVMSALDAETRTLMRKQSMKALDAKMKVEDA